jgi:hypothetical protein
MCFLNINLPFISRILVFLHFSPPVVSIHFSKLFNYWFEVIVFTLNLFALA